MVNHLIKSTGLLKCIAMYLVYAKPEIQYSVESCLLKVILKIDRYFRWKVSKEITQGKIE